MQLNIHQILKTPRWVFISHKIKDFLLCLLVRKQIKTYIPSHRKVLLCLEEKQWQSPNNISETRRLIETAFRYMHDFSYSEFFVNKLRINYCEFGQKMLDIIFQERPEYIILAEGVYSDFFLFHGIWKIITDKLKIKTFFFMPDSIQIVQKLHLLDHSFSGFITIDAPLPDCIGIKNLKQRSCFIFTPVDPQYFFRNNCMPKKVLVSMCGSSHYPERRKIIDLLRQNNISVLVSGGQYNSLKIDQYADLLRQSSMTLNTPEIESGEEKYQLKGRIIESLLCGCVPVEKNNPVTNMFLRPDRDYISYNTPEEIPQKIHYYLKHPNELEQIRKSGIDRAHEIFSMDIFVKSLTDFILGK